MRAPSSRAWQRMVQLTLSHSTHRATPPAMALLRLDRFSAAQRSCKQQMGRETVNKSRNCKPEGAHDIAELLVAGCRCMSYSNVICQSLQIAISHCILLILLIFIGSYDTSGRIIHLHQLAPLVVLCNDLCAVCLSDSAPCKGAKECQAHQPPDAAKCNTQKQLP